MNTIMRTIGGALGAQIAASIVSGHLLASGIPEESGYSEAFAVSAAAMLLAGLAALLIPRRPQAEPARVAPPPVSRRAAAAAR
jgi:hypothetical protein